MRWSMNAALTPGPQVASASWSNQSPTYSLSVLSIRCFYYPVNPINKRGCNILLLKMVSNYMTFCTRALLWSRMCIGEGWFCKWFTHFSPFFFFLLNDPRCHLACVQISCKKNKWLGPILWTYVHIISCTDMQDQNTKVKSGEKKSHQSLDVCIFLQQNTICIRLLHSGPKWVGCWRLSETGN